MRSGSAPHRRDGSASEVIGLPGRGLSAFSFRCRYLVVAVLELGCRCCCLYFGRIDIALGKNAGPVSPECFVEGRLSSVVGSFPPLCRCRPRFYGKIVRPWASSQLFLRVLSAADGLKRDCPPCNGGLVALFPVLRTPAGLRVRSATGPCWIRSFRRPPLAGWAWILRYIVPKG